MSVERGSHAVLVVDDEAVLRNNLVRYLRAHGLDVEGAADGQGALEHLERRDFAVVLTDLRMPGLGGQALLERIVERYPETMVVVMTAYASLESALDTLHHGAQDYILKPLVLEDVARRIDVLLDHRGLELRVRALRRQLEGTHETAHIVGSSEAMAAVLDLVQKAGPSNATVLLTGETGTGKELLARAIHEASGDPDREFLAVNLSAVPADLVDAALFGHERGAFTGAHRRREGIFRAASGGTVFLDEIGELPMAVQAKLLRTLENHEVIPLGLDRPIPVSFRLVVATNRDLERCVDEGAFRQDLFYRLNVFRVAVPPLRDRIEDVPALAEYFVARHARTTGKRVIGLTNEAMRVLMAYRWPGNVRELSNVLERAVLLGDGDWVTPSDLPTELRAQETGLLPLKQAVERFKADYVREVLARAGGDKEEAARLLDVHLATLYRHLEEEG